MSFINGLVAIVPAGLLQATARRLLKATGVGAGGIVATSGEMAAMERALELAGVSSEEPVFIDAGANVGEWTLAAGSKWPRAQIHAFEPSREHFRLLTNALSDRPGVRTVPVALGAEKGQATLYKDKEVTGLASMTRRDLEHLGMAMTISETIAVETLDSYCEDNGLSAIDFLKIDVEGHELDVLAGASRLLSRRAIAAVQFEFGGTNIDTRTFFRDFYRLFQKHGYAIHLCGPGGKLIPIRKYREFNEQFATTNYIAVRR